MNRVNFHFDPKLTKINDNKEQSILIEKLEQLKKELNELCDKVDIKYDSFLNSNNKTCIFKYGKYLTKLNGDIEGYLYEVPLGNYLETINTDPENRTTDDKHINEIYEGIKSDKCLMSTIKAVVSKDNKITLLDGHHRTKSLRKIYKNKINLNVLMEIYYTDDKVKIELLREKANNIRKCEITDKQNPIIIEAINLLKKEFPDMISSKTKVDRPQIKYDDLRDGIHSSGIVKKYNLNSNSLFELLIKINDKLKKEDKKYFDLGKLKTDIYDKANKKGFYLALKQVKINKNNKFKYEFLNHLDKYI